jgi:hypothetical protein
MTINKASKQEPAIEQLQLLSSLGWIFLPVNRAGVVLDYSLPN